MANYTINEIPDTASEVGNADLAVVWQNNATKKISILNFFKNLVKKSEVTNTVSATSESVITSKGVSSLLTIPASNTTITNAPPLQNNATYRFFFTEQITGSDDTTAMSISYNGTSYSVKATANGALKNFTAYPIATEQTRNLAKGEKTEEEKGETKAETKGETKSGTRATVTTYVYCQAYTTLEMMFDGTQFIIMGNPVVISNADYTIYTDGNIADKRIYYDVSVNIIENNVNRWVATQDCLLEWTYISKREHPILIVNENVVSTSDAVGVASDIFYISTCSVKIKKGDVVTSNETWSNTMCRAIPVKS